MVNVVKVNLALHQLGCQLDSDRVRFLIAHPIAVGRMIKGDLGRRPADGQQVLGAVTYQPVPEPESGAAAGALLRRRRCSGRGDS